MNKSIEFDLHGAIVDDGYILFCVIYHTNLLKCLFTTILALHQIMAN